jgi:2'-5' RNA ligase
VNSTGSVGSDAPLRLFCALRLPDDVLDGLVAWGRSALPERRGVRRVSRANLHVTLAFLGRRPAAEVPAIAGELRTAAASTRPARFAVSRYRETRSVGMLVLDDEDGRAGAFALDLFARLEALEVYERERRDWLPHVTVVRFRRAPRLRPPVPPIGTFAPSDAAVYLSRLRSVGAQYDVMESFALGG